MLRALTIPEAPRTWRQWFTLALLVGACVLMAGIAGSGGYGLPAFWVLWAVMAAAGLSLLAVRAVAVARHTAGEITGVERALWATGEMAGALAVCALVLSILL
jgi:hypothetical protein